MEPGIPPAARASSRRAFLHATAATGLLGLARPVHGAPGAVPTHEAARKPLRDRGSFALDGHRIRFFHPALRNRFSVVFIADTHLFTDDQRGAPFREYSGRMAKAYNQTKHFLTGETTHPEQGLASALGVARETKASWVALIGDILSFPSEAGVEFAMAALAKAGIPHGYVAGNHDWHYEGMPGSSDSLRQTWIEKRLQPLYAGRDPRMWSHGLHGIRFVALDNSTYEISEEQLNLWRAEVRTRQPLVLLVHIPLYAPGRQVGFGCGHPEWGARSDKNFELERRPRWRESGHTPSTLAFHREVFAAPNLLGICAGHIHRASLDLVNGIPQIVSEANATGAHLVLEFEPSPGRPDPRAA